jgi:hypothetical protein
MKVKILFGIACLASTLLAAIHVNTQLELEKVRNELRSRQGLSNPELIAMRGWGIVIKTYCELYQRNDEVVSRLAERRLTCSELLPLLKVKSHINPEGINIQKRVMISNYTWKHIEDYGALLVGSEALLGRLIIERNHDRN